jgi:hypothetical protein
MHRARGIGALQDEEEPLFPEPSALGVCLLYPVDRIIMRAAWLKRRW